MARTAGRSQKFIVAGFVVSIHLLFLLYLHFAYHRVVEGKLLSCIALLLQRKFFNDLTAIYNRSEVICLDL